jgi:ABC-type amino acid transport system permease subunit
MGVLKPMNVYVECFVMIPFVVVMFQFYHWIVSLKGVERQKHCQALGITYTTLGTVCLMFRSLALGIVGLILFMLGMRLIAYGLDRINKTNFIDRAD